MALYPLLRPAIFRLDAERTHRLSIALLKLRAGTAFTPEPPSTPLLEMTVAGLTFPNPIGLAAGFDKDAEVFGPMLSLGFGSVEVGTLTPLPQDGNPRPRLFRLVEDCAVINRFGFNNRGQADALERLSKRHRTRGIVGVNVGANKDSADRIADYVTGIRSMAAVADYLTVNISSPNTPGLRQLQDEGALIQLLAAVRDARPAKNALEPADSPPVFLKVAPDLEPVEIDRIVRAAIDHGIDALIVANTTVSRPSLRSGHAAEQGGLSGAPLKSLALATLRHFRNASGGTIPLIAAGGIASGEVAFERIRAGASLVQLYSALVYEGPGLARRMARNLAALLRRDGFANVAEAVGTAP